MSRTAGAWTDPGWRRCCGSAGGLQPGYLAGPYGASSVGHRPGRQRACRLSHRVMLWVVLAMGVLTDLPLRQVFKHARRMRPGDKTPSRSNLCERDNAGRIAGATRL